MPLTSEPSGTGSNVQPVALLVSGANGGSYSSPPKQITVPSNVYLVMDGKGSTQPQINTNQTPVMKQPSDYYGDAQKIPRINFNGLDILTGIDKLWIHQKIEIFESKHLISVY